MSVAPPRDMPTPLAAAAQIAAPTSAMALAAPLRDGANHLLGYIMRGVLHHQWSGTTNTTIDLTNRFMTYRNPNCDYLYCWARMDGIVDNGASLTVTAGGGDPVMTTYIDTLSGVVELIAPWDSNDSGYLEVSYYANNCAVRAIMIGELYRQELVAGDDLVSSVDAAARLGGLMESTYIIQSTSAGASAIITEIGDAWDNAMKQAVSWSAGNNQPSIDNRIA